MTPGRSSNAPAGGSSIAAPPSSWRARWNATKAMWWRDIRAIPRPSKKGPPSQKATAKGGARPGDFGQGEAADLRDDPAGRRGRDPDAGERQAGDDRPADQANDRRGEYRLHRRVRHLQPLGRLGLRPRVSL